MVRNGVAEEVGVFVPAAMLMTHMNPAELVKTVDHAASMDYRLLFVASLVVFGVFATVVILGAWLWVGDWISLARERARTLPRPESPNILLIVLDSVTAGHLSLVVRAGAGYDTIDVEAASARGIYVSNCTGKNSIAVAELTFALILALDRRIPANSLDLKAPR